MTDETKIQVLEADIDKQIERVRDEMFQAYAVDLCDIGFVAALMRAAYGKGLVDALEDPEGAHTFIARHGYAVPATGEKRFV